MMEKKNSKQNKRERTTKTTNNTRPMSSSQQNLGFCSAYKIVEVEWLDAQSGFSCPLTIEELEREKPIHTLSVGYLLKEDEEKVILGFMMFGDEGMFKHWQLIPKGMIKQINQITIKKRHFTTNKINQKRR